MFAVAIQVSAQCGLGLFPFSFMQCTIHLGIYSGLEAHVHCLVSIWFLFCDKKAWGHGFMGTCTSLPFKLHGNLIIHWCSWLLEVHQCPHHCLEKLQGLPQKSCESALMWCYKQEVQETPERSRGMKTNVITNWKAYLWWKSWTV